ncbi:hypothetical protein DRH14_05175 [Candidatus Shapirobacteria bacterium]|nr:MAG: hypothetical protein DRH14_05175 [Candidatus Shapirobacteria bacterium]
MIIGIDVSSVQYGTGVSDYTLQLVTHLLKIDPRNQYKLFFASLRQPLPTSIQKLSQHKNLTIYKYKIPATLLEILWNRLRLLPIEFFIGKCDVFHTSDWTQPPAQKAKLVTTIHDLSPFLFPQWSHPKIVKNHQRKMKLASQNCRQFICVSKNSQRDLLRLFPKIDKNKTSLVYEAVNQKYFDFQKLSNSQQQNRISKLKQKYELKQFILAQGTRQPRKNLDRLIQAFIQFRQENPNSEVDLAIGGKFGWGTDINQHQPSFIKILGYVPETDMVDIHASALALIYPSLYEGFGLPVLKAMAVGTPVITSRNSSLIEVSGQATILINPKSINDIKQAISKIVSNNKLRQSLIKKGLINASKYSWLSTATQTLAIYQKLANN